MLSGHTLEGNNEVLQVALLLALLRALSVHEVVESDGVLEEVVHSTQDTEDTKGEDPDTDNSDNGSLSRHEPTKETEESSNDIDNQNSASKLPRWDARPEWAVGTSDEDKPVLCEGDLQEQYLVADTKVLNDTTILTMDQHGSESDPGTNSKDTPKKDGHTP